MSNTKNIQQVSIEDMFAKDIVIDFDELTLEATLPGSRVTIGLKDRNSYTVSGAEEAYGLLGEDHMDYVLTVLHNIGRGEVGSWLMSRKGRAAHAA